MVLWQTGVAGSLLRLYGLNERVLARGNSSFEFRGLICDPEEALAAAHDYAIRNARPGDTPCFSAARTLGRVEVTSLQPAKTFCAPYYGKHFPHGSHSEIGTVLFELIAVKEAVSVVCHSRARSSIIRMALHLFVFDAGYGGRRERMRLPVSCFT